MSPLFLAPSLLMVSLVVSTNVSQQSKSSEQSKSPEYTYILNLIYKTTNISKEPIETTQLTATITCFIFKFDVLSCTLYDVNSLTTLTYKNHVKLVSKEPLKSEDWFQIKFNYHGVETILVKTDNNNEDIIREIGYQFDTGNDLKLRMSNMPHASTFTARESLPIGTCTTKYNVTVTSSKIVEEEIEEETSSFRIIPLMMLNHFENQKSAHVHIEKNRTMCDYSQEYSSLNVIKYVHTITVINDKLTITTILNGQLLPDPRNSSEILLINKTTLLKLIDIKYTKPILFDYNFNSTWIDIK